MDIIAEIRRRHLVSRESISAIARSLNLSRPTVRKHLSTQSLPAYQRSTQPSPKLSPFQAQLESWLETERHLPKAQRRTARRLFEGLQSAGYQGGYDSIQRFVKQWKAQHHGPSLKQVFVPLAFAPGETCQFDWSQEQVEVNGVIQTVKVAHFRLAYSRLPFVAAYPCETQEMLFDAHNRAFAFFGGVPQRMVYDNLKTVVTTILRGKSRLFNARFMMLANHYLFEPIACTPAAGWGEAGFRKALLCAAAAGPICSQGRGARSEGQVENQVGNLREWFFTPMPRFASFDELNDWLALRCRALGARKHPESGRSIADVFAEEQSALRTITASFDGYVEEMVRVSSTCLVQVERNRYSVPADFAGKGVTIHLSADQVRVVFEREVIAAHPRHFGRHQLICDPWHYLPVLEKKPGALRNGVPFLAWDLPQPIQKVRDHLLKQVGGDRAFVELLLLAREVGLEPLQVACELALESGVIQAAVVMNEMRRLITPDQPASVNWTTTVQLREEPRADCARYDLLRGDGYVLH